MKFLILSLCLFSLNLFSAEKKEAISTADKWKIYASILSMDTDTKVHIETRDQLQFRIKIISPKKNLLITDDSHLRIDTSRTRFVNISNYSNEILVVVRESGQFENIDLYDAFTGERLTNLSSFGQIEYDANNQHIFFKINKEYVDPKTDERSYRFKDLRWPQSTTKKKSPKSKKKSSK